MQLVDIDGIDGEETAGAEHFLPFGVSYVPHEGAEIVTVYPGGARSHPVVLPASDRRYRKSGMQPGEFAIHDDSGEREVYLSKDGVVIRGMQLVRIVADKVVVESPEIHLGGEGGRKIARVGDPTSDGAVITGGSTSVFAVD